MSTTEAMDEAEFKLGDIQTAPPNSDLVMEMTEEDGAQLTEVPPITALAQTSSVWIYNTGCANGATTSFAIPVVAYGWRTRLDYYRADGTRVGLSPIYDWNRSFYTGSRPAVRFSGHLPAGTKDLRAFWWYEGGITRWHKKAMTC